VTAARDRDAAERQTARKCLVNVSQRNSFFSDSVSAVTEAQVTSARASIARLETTVSSLHTDQAFLRSLKQENEELRSDLLASRACCDAATAAQERAERECANIRARVVGLATAIHHGSGLSAAVAPSRAQRKRSRSHSSSRSSRSRSRRRQSSPTARSPPPSTSSRRSTRGSIAASSSDSPSEGSSDDEVSLATLSSSRSASRRRSGSGGSEEGSSFRPICLDPVASPARSSAPRKSGKGRLRSFASGPKNKIGLRDHFASTASGADSSESSSDSSSGGSRSGSNASDSASTTVLPQR
jgi:hypothetical protein